MAKEMLILVGHILAFDFSFLKGEESEANIADSGTFVFRAHF
ncbi:MAG TPA: hypothetical protein VFA09_00695 [Ktedonobacteraceae bacterium]|jgi:hypothetical protein|nr:hypothetical protein [Ktedonobacteraceae bacterium]